ncbi:GlpM family protein [Rummeliibacillus pycnus]|uniref:GlpM family protein n=1 Tax=Rummeliibacillus pycnus TaxID=101070 RepID=UPI003D2CD2EA
MGYVIQFIIGGTVMMFAAMLSKSKYLFLSGVITLLPILTLMNLHLQVRNMTEEKFHITQRNGIIGAIGMVVLVGGIYFLSNWFKPGQSVLIALTVYVVFMVGSRFLIA